jgi:hypothetical protein
MAEREHGWRQVALSQAGLVTRVQLAAAGVSRAKTAYRVAHERWQVAAPTVVCTTTGELTSTQRLWLGVLHGGGGALVAGVHALELAGLRNWTRDDVTVLVPYAKAVPPPLAGFRFVRTRRPLADLRSGADGVPRCRTEPAALLFAAEDRSARTAQGLLAAVVQQRLTTPDRLSAWLEDLRPLRRAALLRDVLTELGGGAQSVAEIDVKRLCRTFGLTLPRRQVRRRDSEGRLRFTDCEWRLTDGRTLVLEVDGLFHMSVESWEDDLARQRALSATDRLIVRCTAREVRDEPERLARDLVALGVPRAA